MFLRGIEIQGFKSFPDKTKLAFEGGITAVVGPNGSGKSNISDAVRWVLGEQSTKSLRSSKMEDVIFGGTAKRRALGFAEVTLVIDNTDRALEFDKDEICVTRRYYRSGESEYQIGRATVRLKDLHELFMDTGLGRDGYSMIGQGKIDDIVGSKSTERRDIFEEAAGISRFRYRKAEAERKLSQAEENLLRLRDILSELESRVKPLKEQSEKAEKFLMLSGEKRELEIGLWLHNLEQSKKELREQDYKITLVKIQHEEIESELVKLDREMQRTQEDNQKLAAEIDDLRRGVFSYEEQAAKAGEEIAVQKNNILHNRETILRLNRDIQHYQSGEEEIAKEIKIKRAEIQAKEEYIEECRLKLEQSGSKLEKLIHEGDSYSSKEETLAKQMNQLTAQISEEKLKSVTAESSLGEISARRIAVYEMIQTVEEQWASLQNEQEELEKDTGRITDFIEECRNALKGYQLRYDARRENCRQVKEEIDQMFLDAKANRRRAQMLEDLEKNLEGYTASVKAVMNQSRQGKLTGIHGPLSRLIKVDPSYATAIEVALGANMQNIVVSTQEDAKRAIHFLKTQKAGRATFLPINSIKRRTLRESDLESARGYVGVAADLVDCAKEYKEIVHFAVGKVVVAEDLDSAVEIAQKYGYRFRIVTLDGQVVNTGGSMTGGSLTKGAGLLSRASEIERIRRKAQDAEKKANEKNEQYKTLLLGLSKAEADIKNASAELTTAQEDSIRIEGEKRRVGEHIKIAETQLESLTKEKEMIAQRMVDFEQVRESSKELCARLENQLGQLEKEREALTDDKDILAGQREQLLRENSEIRLEISGAEKDIKTLETLIDESQSRRDDQFERVKQLKSEIESISGRMEQSSAEIIRLEKLAEELRNTAKEKTQIIDTLNKKRAVCEQKISEYRAAEREQTANREKTALDLARLQERRDGMIRKQDEIINKLYDEYELTRSEAEAMDIQIEDIQSAGKRLLELRGQIRALGHVNVAAIEEYKEVSERYHFMNTQIQDVEASKDELHKLISELTAKMREMFSERFTQINKHFSSTFVDLFGGGTAQLRLTNPEDVLESGIEIIVQPPGKNISIIEQLSGGEKALIAISIYFAIMKVSPPPFCVLDEVEAALDEVNVGRFAEYLRRMSSGTQFIVITHRRGTMEEADMLYGVTMQEKGVSKLLELNVAQVAEQNLLSAE